MTVHSATTTIDLEAGIVLIQPGLRNSISLQSDMHLFLNASWINMESALVFSVSGSVDVYPPLTFRDSTGNPISKVVFESVYPGSKSGVQTITAVNGTDTSITVTLTPEVSPTQIGSSSDTYGSLYLSNDDSLYYQTIDVVVAANDTTDFYVYYQPPSNAKIGAKEWNLDLDTDIVTGDWLYGDNLTITSISPVSEYDTIILVTVDYEAGKMETDFSDIRFWLEGTLLDSSIYNKVDSDYANFTVMIPALSSGEVITLNVLSGNSTVDVKQDYVYNEWWDWLDGTLSPWVETLYGTYSGVDVGTGGFGYNTLRAWSRPISSDATMAEAPANGAYGHWVIKYKFTTSYTISHLARWYFVDDGINSYSVYIDSDSETINLYLNDTLLTSASFIRSANTRILEILRDLDGNFTIKVDGVTYLTAADNTIKSSIKEKIWFHSSYGIREWWIDYIYFIEEEEYPPTVSAFDNWDDRLDLPCYGNVLFQSRELPELEPEQRYTCQIGANYYE